MKGSQRKTCSYISVKRDHHFSLLAKKSRE